MQRDLDALQDEHITHLLGLWHRWSRASDRVAMGYARTSPGFEAYRASRQMDDWNGALDDAADMELARTVDSVIGKMQDPWRTALHVEARNIDAPARVWATARIIDLKAITLEARSMLWVRLESAGIV